jgi:hypothetical protein
MVVAMYAVKFFTLDTFLYEVAYDLWLDMHAEICRGKYV